MVFCLELDGVAPTADASIKDYQQARVGYVANALEQALLLPGDMADLRSMRKYKVFLNLKRDLALVSPPITPYILLLLYYYIYLFLFLYSYLYLISLT